MSQGNGIPGEIFPEDIGQKPADPDQPTTNTYGSVGTTPDGLVPTQPAYPTAPALGVYSSWMNMISPDATTLLYGTWLGGALDNRVYGPYVDVFGECWIFGWIETFRNYTIFSSTGSPTSYTTGTSLPGSMLTPNAFKPHPDNGATTFTPFAYGLLDEFGNGPFLAAPPFLGGNDLRDGWVDKLRIGLPALQTLIVQPGNRTWRPRRLLDRNGYPDRSGAGRRRFDQSVDHLGICGLVQLQQHDEQITDHYSCWKHHGQFYDL